MSSEAPSTRESKAEWVAYAVEHGFDRADAEAMTKAELMVCIYDELRRADGFAVAAPPEPEAPAKPKLRRVAPRVWVDDKGRRYRW